MCKGKDVKNIFLIKRKINYKQRKKNFILKSKPCHSITGKNIIKPKIKY